MSDIHAIESALFAAWEKIAERMQNIGFDGLAYEERVYVAIWMLEAEVNNGGFSQYLFNYADGDMSFVTEALREVGATDVAAVCEGFFALLPGGRPARTQLARQEQLEAAESAMGADAFEEACGRLEQRFYALEDLLRERLHVYARTHGLVTSESPG